MQEYLESVTERSKGHNMYACPICDSGHGKHGTGAFSMTGDGTRWKCFACDNGGDIFDLIGAVHNTTDHSEQLRIACAFFGISLDGHTPGQNQDKSGQYAASRMRTTAHTQTYTQTHTHTESAAMQEDYKPFFLEAHSHISETDYPQSRGLSPATIARFKLGYVPAWKHPKAPENAPATPRLIIPTSPHGYLARDTRADIPEGQQQYSKQKVGSMQIFNRRALKDAASPVFIVEGELDALSIIEAGGEAVALGSVSMVRRFLQEVQATPPQQPLIISLDNDASGKEAAEKLEAGLLDMGIFSYRCNVAGQYKDANEALQHDRETLQRYIVEAGKDALEEAAKYQEEATEAAEREKLERVDKYLQSSAAHHIKSFMDGIAARVDTPAIDTGFFYLNKALGDTYASSSGLYEGLYIVGAISSLGKTTFCMQLADQIAQAGQDVLIFSLEMARTELMAKSISRHTCQLAEKQGIDMKNAKTARGITTGARYACYSEQEKQLINDAVEAYSQYAGRIFISEGIGNIGVEQVRAAVAEHLYLTGRAPVVLVDYLQILAPVDPRMTDKQNTDKAVMELKRISRDYKIPIIGISSFNRQNYKEAVSMEAFKESGAIEYSSDVLIGLQFKGTGKKDFDVNAAKSATPREVELVILKNRNGQTGKTVNYNYYPMFNYYREMP